MTVASEHEKQHKCPEMLSIERFRCILAQFVATTVKNMLLFDMGLYMAFLGIIIPALTGVRNEHNQNEPLSLTPEQSSWLGSFGFIFEPLGCILSAIITDPLGRRRAMMIVNIPFIIGWLLMYNASSVVEVFIANALLGLGVGLMESPIITYLGEITEPSVRGVMIAYSAITGTLGMLFVFVLNTLMPWRTVALVCVFVPILALIALYFIPETPLWLLSKNRTSDAEEALCWLRGWVQSATVANEMHALQRYSERSKACDLCIKQNRKCSHPLPTMIDKFRELKRKQTLKPFLIVMSLFVISSFSGIFAMQPFIVKIFKAYESPIAPDQTAALMSFANNVGNVAFLCLLRFTGKRRLYLTMLSGVLFSASIVCIYGFIVLPSGFNSFNTSQEFSLGNKSLGYIPFICIILWSTFTYCGVNSLPWQLLSEVFPYKTRGMASGITAALNYAVNFVASKTYYNLETWLSLPGVTLFNCIVISLGFIWMYNILPETENRTLEDIEIHFSDKTKRICDHKIPKMKSKQKSNDAEARSTSTINSDVIIDNGQFKYCDNRGFEDIQL